MVQRPSFATVLRHFIACGIVATTAFPFVTASAAPDNLTEHRDDEVPSQPSASQLAECVVTWGASSDYCKDRKDKQSDGKCTTLLQCQAETLAGAKEYCDKATGAGGGKSGVESCGPCKWAAVTKSDPVEKCKQLCDKVNEDCIARCPKGDKGCMNECNQEYGKCLKDCEK